MGAARVLGESRVPYCLSQYRLSLAGPAWGAVPLAMGASKQEQPFRAMHVRL